MKRKRTSGRCFVFSALLLLSWGVTGHRTIGRIASNHLTPAATAAVHALLGDQTLADVSNWADSARSTAQYRQTAPWHFLNVPDELNFQDFQAQVTSLTQENVYSAILKCEADLKSSTTTRDEKAVALKFLVHFIEDIHQPMHVSRAEDKGGNTIQVNYDGQGTNLHALWDAKLIDHGGLNDEQLAAQYDHLTPAQIKQWQNTPVIQWAWESYQISSRLYTEVAQMNKRVITDDYYQQHMPIIEQRIQQAGIRLAFVLNDIFKAPVVNAAAPHAMAAVAASAPSADTVTVCDRVFGGRYFENSGLTLLNLGAEYPNQTMSIVIRSADRSKFKDAPETYFIGKRVCVTGKQEMYKGKPEMVVSEPAQIQVKE